MMIAFLLYRYQVRVLVSTLINSLAHSLARQEFHFFIIVKLYWLLKSTYIIYIYFL
jgi:hypothetical protein